MQPLSINDEISLIFFFRFVLLLCYCTVPCSVHKYIFRQFSFHIRIVFYTRFFFLLLYFTLAYFSNFFHAFLRSFFPCRFSFFSFLYRFLTFSLSLALPRSSTSFFPFRYHSHSLSFLFFSCQCQCRIE